MIFDWKRSLIKKYGREHIEIRLFGGNYAETEKFALEYQREHGGVMFHPYEDTVINEGNGVIGVEVLDQMKQHVDFVFLPIGGGGLAAGIITYFSEMSPSTQIVGVQDENVESHHPLSNH